MITALQLSKSLNISLERAQKWAGSINFALRKYNINSPMRIAHFIAQIGHESGRLIYVAEIASGKAYDNRADLGNTKPQAIEYAKKHASTPGRWFKGHGIIQITGFDNHVAVGKALGLDLLNKPHLLEEVGNASMSAAWFWDSRDLNKLADQDLLTRITQCINGGLNGINDRRALLVSTK